MRLIFLAIATFVFASPVVASQEQSPSPQPLAVKAPSQTKLSAEDIAALLTGQEIYYDDLGLIVHRDNDGGDTAQREGWYWLGVWIRQHELQQPWTKPRKLTFSEVLQLLEPKADGVFHRHPKYDARDLNWGFSRDQMVPLVAAMGVWGMQTELRRLWNALPGDFLGKHSFNGEWQNLLGQSKEGCDEIKNRGCDATRDCTLKEDTRDCSLKTDNRDCSYSEDTRNCQPTDNCKHCDGWDNLNPACQAERAACLAQKEKERIACEAEKAAENLRRKLAHDNCELNKAAQNVTYMSERAACEAAKAEQNILYKGEHDLCEATKTAEKIACEADKAAAYKLCFMSTKHSGDFVGPMTINLFRRAWGEDPMPASDGNGLAGELELLANVKLRLIKASRDRADTGDDLNLIVMLLMAKLRYPSSISDEAAKMYAQQRPMSFGSFFGTYFQTYGNDMTDLEVRIANGIRNGWQPDAPAPLGAVRWYHRASAGANPQLAEMYENILAHYLY